MSTCNFTFGRVNPPTIGHEKLLKAVQKEAASADWFIIPSQTHKKPKDPLPYDYKAATMKKMFPSAADHIDDKACERLKKILQEPYERRSRSSL